MGYLFLALAVVTEVGATLALRQAAHGHRAWFAPVAIGYVLAFGMLALSLAEGIALGIAYGIWAATGVALTAVASKILFGEPLTRRMAAGIGIIVVGVLVIELGAAH